MIKWDVKLEEPVPYFDSRLSYELSGYRPITTTQGLDFNPEDYTQAKQTYLRDGKYTQFHFGTKNYDDFWYEEYMKCRDGCTVNGYTITGDNYFFLNCLNQLANTT